MRKLEITKKLKTDITITQNPQRLIRKYFKRKNILVCDKNTYNLIDVDFDDVINIESNLKDASTLEVILKSFLKSKVDRDTSVFCLSGGSLSDIVGFACGVWMRGVDYILIPTTLLSQVDASIGGKTALDWFGIRNMIGCFHFPSAVIINPEFTLKQDYSRYLEGFGEIFKYIIVMDRRGSREISSIIPGLLKREKKYIKRCIEICVDFKIRIVKKDPFDTKNIRVILNFGHTPAHAIESVYKIPHGDAVLYGCLFELMLSEDLGYISKYEIRKYIEIFYDLKREIHIKEDDFKNFLRFIEYDKKNTSSKNTFLVRADSDVKVVKNVDEKILKRIWRRLCRKEFL